MASIPINSLTTNVNTSPGMSSHVFHRSLASNTVQCTSMRWGLASQTQNKLLFNARSETIYDKPTFQPLITKGQTCIWVVDGYYEWKEKQPYFICRKDGLPMLLAGLWMEGNEKTFTILTMNAFPTTLEKIHPRQPVMLWDYELALKWLDEPNCNLVNSMSCFAKSEQTQLEGQLLCYPVTKRMSDGKYHGDDCTKEIKLSNIMSFFGKSDDGDGREAPIKQSSINVQQKEGKKPTMTKKHPLNSQNDSVKDDASWTCKACTYIHTDKAVKFLVCEMCGAERVASDADKGSIRSRDSATSRAWGSLCSPTTCNKKRKK